MRVPGLDTGDRRGQSRSVVVTPGRSAAGSGIPRRWPASGARRTGRPCQAHQQAKRVAGGAPAYGVTMATADPCGGPATGETRRSGAMMTRPPELVPGRGFDDRVAGGGFSDALARVLP